MRYTPFETMERMFDQMFRDMSEWREQTWDDRLGFGLNTDLAEHDDEYVLTVDLPGFETEEIDLRYDDGVLHLSASHEVSEESETAASSRSRTVSERIAIPRQVVAEEIEASYRNGVLEVHLPVVEGGEEHGHRIDVE
jgi:HSP20 family protein